jgi:hypothetical protein
VASKRQQVQYFGGAMTALCELMSGFGISKSTAQEQFHLALERGYAKGILPLSGEVRPITKMADLCRRWYFEKAYIDSKGKPRPLTWDGRSGTLLRLAERVIGRKDAKAVVGELVTRKLVRRTRHGGWLPRAQVVRPAGLDTAQVLRTATMVERLLRTVAYNSERNYRGEVLLEVLAQVPRLPTREITAFKKFAKTQGLIFAMSVDDWLESRNIPRSQRNKMPTREAGVVAFAFEQASQKNS